MTVSRGSVDKTVRPKGRKKGRAKSAQVKKKDEPELDIAPNQQLRRHRPPRVTRV